MLADREFEIRYVGNSKMARIIMSLLGNMEFSHWIIRVFNKAAVHKYVCKDRMYRNHIIHRGFISRY